MTNCRTLFKIMPDVSWDKRLTVSWQWEGGSFEKNIDASRISTIHREFRQVLKEKERIQIAELTDFGKTLGDCFFGRQHVEPFLDLFDTRRQRFALLMIPGNIPEIASLPWELLILPGTQIPMLFLPAVRGCVDFARTYDVGPDIHLRRTGPKCLAVWANSPSRPLLVRPEIEELKNRLNRYPSIRFRWVRNPGTEELKGRLNLECSLFLYAGHGKLDNNGYTLELNDESVEIDSLLPNLKKSRAEILIFDSCDSGLGNSGEGVPACLEKLPSAQGLLGMQGPAVDSLSCWYIPSIIEQLFLGRPLWESVNLLRNLLYEQGSDGWFLPVVHVKDNYKPFENMGEKKIYLDYLSKLMADRKGDASGG